MNEVLSPVIYANFIAGFSYKPLSALSFLKPGKIPRTVPMTPELERQHGSDILCWPYTLSPLSLPEFAKSLSQSQLILGDNATWDPESLNFEMVGGSFAKYIRWYLITLAVMCISCPRANICG